MKCKKCDQQATFHITEMVGGNKEKIHLCEKHAREYLEQTQNDQDTTLGMTVMQMAQQIASQMSRPGASPDLTELDGEKCPYCDLSFFEFRNLRRVGCAEDYLVFAKQLEEVLMGIHGSVKHCGKRPERSARLSAGCAQILLKRRALDKAVKREQYELAGELRDEILNLEREAGIV